MSNPSITADKTPWYQWDTGLTVTVSGGAMDECHFANRKQGTAYVQAVINGVARVPDELLQVAAPIKAYGYVSDGAGGQTYVEQSFEVIARNIPADYTYTKTAQKTIRDAESARDQAVQAAKDAKASELAADDSAVEASNSAQSAGESASAATTSASNAAKSAGDAAKSASDAKAAADKAVEDASELLKTYTDNAKTSADNAATSASNAADAASSASGSASAAAQSATDASNAKAAAQTAKAEAATSASNAATSASNAASSATAAAKSASDAAESVGETLNEAKKYTDANTSNALVGTVSGKLLHVEDVWPSPVREFVVYGKSEQSITTGKNLWDIEHPTSINDGCSITRDSDGTYKVIADDTHQIAGYVISVEAGETYYIRVKSPAKTACGIASVYDGATEDATNLLNKASIYEGASLKTFVPTGDSVYVAYVISDGNVVSDGITVVEPMICKSSQLVAYEPYTGGKPSPSPEYPQEIVSIDKAKVTSCGKNLLVRPYVSKNGTDNGVTYTENIDGSVTASGTATEMSTFTFVSNRPIKAGTYTISADMPVGCGIVFVCNKSRISTNVTSTNRSGTLTIETDDTCIIYLFVSRGITVNATIYTQVELGSLATDYSQYVGTSTPFTLPAEHPYLAALPDGTHDEIVIDKDGNASLVARVGKTETAATDGVNATVGTDALSSTGAIEDGATVYYKLETPVTYPLGKLDIPSLPETISNVWTDAELTTNMHMTYKRDINIAFDNLVQSVVAAAAGE